MRARVIVKGLALILSLALLGYLFKTSDLGSSVNEAWIDARVRGHGVNGALLFLLMGGIFTAIGLPRQIIAFLGGYAFSIRPVHFLVGTLLGYLPQTLVFALVGSGVQLAPALKLALAIGLFLVSGALGAYLYRHFRHGQSLDAQIDAALDENIDAHESTTHT